MKKKILVTGGTGYIGFSYRSRITKRRYEVVIIDNLSNSNVEVIDGIERSPYSSRICKVGLQR